MFMKETTSRAIPVTKIPSEAQTVYATQVDTWGRGDRQTPPTPGDDVVQGADSLIQWRVHRKHPRNLKIVDYVRVWVHVTSGHAWVIVGSAPRGTSGSGKRLSPRTVWRIGVGGLFARGAC